MTHAHVDPEFGSTSDKKFDNDTTRTLLQIALVQDQSTVERLVDALAAPDGGEAMLERMHAQAPLPFEVGMDHTVPEIDVLKSLKSQGKRRVSSAMTDFDRLIGAWQYILAAACAMAFHGERISSSDDAELRPIFLDLAEVLSNLWSGIFEAAARRCGLSAPGT
ncbi:MAG: hypothetical protein AAFX05_13595 [Planctomycetota bacterium]